MTFHIDLHEGGIHMASYVTFSFEVNRLPIVLGMGLCLQEL